MRLVFSSLVVALGFFSIVAQALLFRTHLAVLEGSELAVGSFFGTWLLWVAFGALLGRGIARVVPSSVTALAWLALLYVPAFLLQDTLTWNARAIAGVAVYEVLPLDALLGVSLLANAPVSLLTGVLFTLACRVGTAHVRLPVARTWVLECLGGFAGGLAVTLLLARGLEAPTVFGIAALVLAIAAGVAGIASSRRGDAALLLPLLAIFAALVFGVDRTWAEARDAQAWTRLFPGETAEGAFVTPQGRYVHGVREGVFTVVAWGGTAEVVPDAMHASEVVAIHLAQHPSAKRVLVVGPSSFEIGRTFASLPQVEHVAWSHPDPAYPAALWAVLPERIRASATKLEVVEEDVAAHLECTGDRYDLVVLNLPDVTTLVENRFVTWEFFRRVRARLPEDGVVSLRISGGENVLGGELRNLGASAFLTLQLVFSHVALKPGDESWLFASDADSLSTAPAVLRDRFASVEGADAVYPPEALFGLYLPDRIAYQMDLYGETIENNGVRLLLNTEGEPKALLHTLALSAKRTSGRSLAAEIPVWLRIGAGVLAAGLLLYLGLRALYLWAGRRHGVGDRARPAERPFDAGVLILTTGAAGMALGVVLMFGYQTRFGSLYLDVGLFSSLFMLGLFLGGAIVMRVLAKRLTEPAWLLWCAVVLSLLVVLGVSALPGGATPRWVFALLLLAAGATTGTYFPLAAHRLRTAGRNPARSGAALEAADHLGGAVGAAATGLVLLPLFGTTSTLALLALLIAINLAPRLVPLRARQTRPLVPRVDRAMRAAGYVLAGVTLFVLVGGVAAARTRADLEADRFEDVARELAGDRDLEQLRQTLPRGREIAYFAILGENEEPDGWIFPTRDLTWPIAGYGGEVSLVVHVDGDGALLDFAFLDSRETPAYAAMLAEWREGLKGTRLFVRDPLRGIDAVSGATVTSDAVRSCLEWGGERFGREVVGLEIGPTKRITLGTFPEFVLLSFLLVVALVLRYWPRRWVRRGFLLVVLLVLGFRLNLQYSAHQIVSLVYGELPVFVLSSAFFLVVIVPVAVLLFGNVYCGYLCPFGAAQELLGDLGRRRWQTDPHTRAWRYGRSVKYVLLALLLLAVVLSGRREVLEADPLVTVFGGAPARVTLVLVVASLLLAVVFGRFWCRSLCPAGAFLALLNRVRLLRALLPKSKPGRCDLGVRSHHELDCICCDRCRHAPEIKV